MSLEAAAGVILPLCPQIHPSPVLVEVQETVGDQGSVRPLRAKV